MLAVVLPALILGLVASWYTGRESYALTPTARRLEEKLAGLESSPEIVILGNSLAGRGIDEKRLAQIMGLDEDEVVKLHLGQTRPPTWYAVLKNRVYANGYEPKVVIVASILPWLLQNEPDTQLAWDLLADQMVENDEVILKKAFGQEHGPLALQRAKLRRARVRENLLDGVRDLAVGIWWGGRGKRPRSSHDIAEDAMNRVFMAEGSVDHELHHRVIPVVETGRDRPAGDVSIRRPKKTFLPHFADLCADHGSALVVVRLPISQKAEEVHWIPDNFEDATKRLLKERGVRYLDLSGLAIPPSGFYDRLHLSTGGRAVVTDALGRKLIRWDIMSTGAPVDVERKKKRRSKRKGKKRGTVSRRGDE